MYNSLLILNDNLSQSVKDVVHAIKKNDCLILEINFETTSFEEIQTQVNDIYTERQVLGDDLDLETITFFFTENIEYTDVFSTYSEIDGKQILYDVSNVDSAFTSWNHIKDFVSFCKENFSSLTNIDFIDVNHIFYQETWSNIFDYIRTSCDIDNDSMLKINYISSDFSNKGIRRDKLVGSTNWLSDIIQYYAVENTVCCSICERVFNLSSENKSLVETSTLFDIGTFVPTISSFSDSRERVDFAKILIVPLVQQKNNTNFAKFIQQANTQYSTCFMILNDSETSQSLMQKYTSVVGSYIGEVEKEYYDVIHTGLDESGNPYTIKDVSYNIKEIEMKMAVYLPMYWNDKDVPDKEIRLSKNLNTISLDVDESHVFLEDNILENLVSLVKVSHNHISKIYFEIFNMNQNYNQSLDIIFTKLSSLPEYQNFVGFYYSSLMELSMSNHSLYFADESNASYNTCVYHMIYYENGEKCHYYNEPRHNVMDYMNITNYDKFVVSDYIERNKIHNALLFDRTLDIDVVQIEKVQRSLTPNTVMIPFEPTNDSYERVMGVLKSMSGDPHVDFKNVSIFQDYKENSESYTLFDANIVHSLKDVSMNDPELGSWSDFKNFVFTLQNDLSIENLDLLMCKIYSDENWRYVLSRIESELTTLNIRSSDDNTGHIMFDGDWVLESEGVDVNMIRVYFTEEVKNLEIVLGGFLGITALFQSWVSKDQQSVYNAGVIMNSAFNGTQNTNYFKKITYYNSSDSNLNILEEGEKIVQFVSNNNNVIFSTSNNKVYTYGKNTYSSLGIGNTNTGYKNYYPQAIKFENDEDVLGSKKVKMLFTTDTIFGILFYDGSVYAAGKNSAGEFGTLDDLNTIYTVFTDITPTSSLDSDEKIVRVAGNIASWFALTNKDKLYSTGNGTYAVRNTTANAAFGESSFEDTLETGEKIDAIMCHGGVFLYTNQKNIYVGGLNNQYQIGLTNNTNQLKFVLMPMPSGATMDKIWLGSTCVFTYDATTNKYYSCGVGGRYRNLQNRGGNPEYQAGLKEIPVDVYTRSNNSHVRYFNGVGNATSLMNENNEVFSWSYNDSNGKFGALNTVTSKGFIQYPTRTYMGTTANEANYFDDALFPHGHFSYMTLDEIDEANEYSGNITIPLVDEFKTILDASSNYIYLPKSINEYKVDASYVLNVGIFKIKNVPSSSPLAVLNSGQTDKISYFGTTEETVNTTSNVIDIYVSSGTFSTPYFTFYTDSAGTNELSGNVLYLNRSYRFNRLNSATSHPFYISDSGYGSASSTIQLSGDGSATSGITGSQSFTVNFNGLTNSTTLTFYCTVHSSMVGTFSLADSDGYTSTSVDLTGYKFYSGDVYIKVDESFNDLSLYTTGYGGSYLGTEGKIIFDPEVKYSGFTVNNTSSTIIDFPSTTFFNLYQDTDNSFIAVFGNTDEISGNILNTFEIKKGGTYTIKNIPFRFPVAIVESGTTNIDISGDSTKMSSYDINSISTPFYHGVIQLIVPSYGFDKITMYVYDTVDEILHKVKVEPFKDQLQFEYIVNADNATSDEWTANYVVSGTNTITMNSSFELKTDASGNKYYLMTGIEAIEPNYPDTTYITNVDTTSNPGFMWEAWIYAEDLFPNGGVFMSIETDGGPHFWLNHSTISGIGMSPNVASYTGLTSPGSINDSANQEKMLHVIGYMYASTTSDYERGVYINGTKYEQLSTSSVNRANKPGLDSITYPFRVGNYDVGTYNNQATYSCKNLRIYAMRVWHRQLSSSEITALYNAGHTASTLTDINDYSMKFNPENISLDSSLSTEQELPFSSFLNIYRKSSSEVYVRLSGDNELSGNFMDTFNVVNNGIYEIKNIPEKYMLNITEIDSSDVEITGTDTSMSTYSFGDVSYDFYHGNMYLKVGNNDSDISLNMIVYDTDTDISYNLGTKITIQKNLVDVYSVPNDLSGIQFEYIASSENSSDDTWKANYVVSGTDTISINSSFTLGTDTSGNKYYKMTGHTPLQPNYPNYQHILDIDADADNTGFMWEAWVYPENNLTNNLSNNQNALMSIDSGSGGPHFFVNLQDSRGDGNIGMAPSVYKTYEGLSDNPGDINDYVGEMVHLVAYMYPETTTDYNRGVYVNGVHYPQLSTGDTNQSGVPSFDSVQNNFSVGAGLESSGQSCVNLRFYAIRVWHQQLTSSQITALYNAGPQGTALTITPTQVNRGSGGGLPEGVINFKYQPFDYTLSGNENFYCVGATKVHGYMRTEKARTVYLVESSSSWNWARLQFVLFDKANNYRFTPGTLSNNVAGSSSTRVLYFEESGNYSPGKYGWTTTTNKTSLESSYDHFMIVGPTGNANSYYYQDNGTPKYNPNWNMSYYSGNGASNVYSDIFALSLDEELTEDSMLYPIQHIWNGNNHSPKNAKWMVGFTTNTSHISSDSKRYYDWNEKMKELVSGKSNGASVWGSDQLIYLYALKFESEEYIANFASTSSTTKLCLTLDIPESIETIGPYTILDLHPTISKTEYIQTVDFGMAKDQTYVIEAPEDYPLAFAGTLNQLDISYIGYEENKKGQIVVNDVSYDLYSGPLFIQLNESISSANEFTFYTISGEDLNTTSKMFYDASCAVVIDEDTSYVIPDSNSLDYNIKFIRSNDTTTETQVSATLTSQSFYANVTKQGTSNNFNINQANNGQVINIPHSGGGGKNYSMFFASSVYCSEEEAGTWNFGIRTTNDCWSSAYVLKGQYCWFSDSKPTPDSTPIIDKTNTWNNSHPNDKVANKTISQFISHVDTNYADAEIENIINSNRSKTTQVNGNYTFEAKTPYTFLIFWRHSGNATGLSNLALNFGFWKQGTSAVSLPANGQGRGGYFGGSTNYKVPDFFYNNAEFSETQVEVAGDGSVLVPRFDLPKTIIEKDEETVSPINFKYIYFKNSAAGTDKYFHINEIECWLNDENICLSTNGTTALITHVNDITDTVAYSTNHSSNPASNSIDGNLTNFCHGNGDYNSLLLELPQEYDLNQLQRIIVYNRDDAGSNQNLIRGRYHGVDYFQILDSNKDVVVEIDQSSTTASDFEQVSYVNYIGPKDDTYSTQYDVLTTTNKDYTFELSSSSSSSSATMVGETFYSNQVLNVKKGFQYSLNQIPPWYPITILNNGLTDQITITGDSNKLVSGNYTVEVSSNDVYDISSTDASGNVSYYKQTAYNFYYGDVKLNVFDTSFGDISGISMYSTYNGGTKVGPDYMIQTKETPSQFDVDVLQQITKVSVVQDGNGNNIFALNGRNLFVDGQKYGIHIGTYVFTNIPEDYAMAVMNNGVEDIIEYTGRDKKGDYSAPDGNTYPFYYGAITMQVKTLTGLDDVSFSICSFNDGYMGGEGLLKGMNEHHFNIMEQDKIFDSYVPSAESSSENSSGTTVDISDEFMDALQAEFIAGTSTTWSANYMKPGSNGSTTFTNQADLVQGSDSDGYYFRVNTTNRGAYLNNYPNQSEVLTMDNTGTSGVAFEIWFKTPSSLGSNKGWLMGFESGWGPYVCIQDSRMGGMGTSPGATDNNTYNNLTNPGYINNNLNKLYHMVGYWKRNGSYFDRGIYLNGVHYPQENTSTSGYSNHPSLDSISKKFCIGNHQGSTGHHANGTYVYSFRIWHTRLDDATVSKLYNGGCNTSIATINYQYPFPQINFKYQPFDYTYSANSNYYVKGAKLARGNIKVDSLSAYTDYTTTADRYVHRLMFVLENANTGARWTPNTNSAHILALYDYQDALTRDTGNANANNNTLSSLYEYYMKVSATGSAATIGLIFEDASGNPNDGLPSGTIMNTWHQNFTSIYSHRFALSTDASLNEDSILYPIHYVQNGNNWNGGSRYLFTTYYYTNDRLGTDKERHSDWNAQLASSNSMLATGTNMYLYALDLGEEPSSGGSGGSGEIKLLPSIVEYTDSSGVDVSFANPITYNLTDAISEAKGQFKYLYIIADSTFSTMVFREIECYVNGTNVALSSGGASAVWTKTDINTTTTSAHNMGASTNANDGTIVKNGTDSNIAHGHGGNGWTRFLITFPDTYDVKDLQRVVIHTRHLSTNYGFYSGAIGISISKVQLLDEDKSTVSVEWDNSDATFNNQSSNPQGTYVNIFEINFLGPADDPDTTDFTIYDESDTADLSMTTVEYDDPVKTKTVRTYYSECLIDDADMTIIDTDSSGASAPLFNNDVSFEELKVYSVYDGSYNINVGTDASNAIAILNHDVSNAITYTGTTLVDTKTSVYDPTNTYKYYSGTITITVESSFNDVLIFEHLDASSVDTKFSKLMYSKTCDPSILKITVPEEEPVVDDEEDTPVAEEIPDVIICLNATTSANVIQDDASNNVYIFNSYTIYDNKRKFGLHTGTYIINNIPTDHPMAILNHDVSDAVYFSGDDLYGTKQVGDVSYNFYTGTVKLSITKDFSSRLSHLSAYCYHHGYMGAQNYFVFSDTCEGRSGTLDFMHVVNKQCLSIRSTMKIGFDSYGRQKIILNYNSETNNTYDSSLYYGLDIGSYVIENIPDNFPLAIINYDVSDCIQYTGEKIMDYRLNSQDGHYYNYYSGYVKMDVMSIPTDTSFVSFTTSKSNYMYEKDKFLFDDECSTDDYYYDCMNSNTLFDLSGTTIYLNGKTYNNNDTKKIAVYNGYYIIKNVPKDNPISFISTTKQEYIYVAGLEFNKSVLTVDSSNIDFYCGNVVFGCFGDFENDLKLYMKNGSSFETISFYYTDYCFHDAGVDDLTPQIECLNELGTITTRLRDNKLNLIFNNDEDIDDSKIYGINIGLYRFKDINQDFAIRITNTNINDGDIYLSSADEEPIEYTKNDISNNYYFGDVYLHVTSDVSYLDTGIEFDITTQASVMSKDKIIYSSECIDDNPIYVECLDLSCASRVVNGKYMFNEISEYNSILKYGVNIGRYVIHDISSSHPLAILNNDVSGIVSYYGDVLETTQDVSGISYKFYSGKIFITIVNDFMNVMPNGLSYYCSNHGYMGGENAIIFKTICDSKTPGFYPETLNTTTTFELDANNNLKLGFDTYDANRRPSIFIGTYTIQNVPETHPIAVISNLESSIIAYTGTDISGNYEVGDNFYNFYYGTVSIYVMEPIELPEDYDISEFISIYSYPHGYLGTENKICYDNYISNYTDISYVICLNTNSNIEMYKDPQDASSVNYTFNDSSNYYGYKRMGMHIGNYRLVNVPMSDPIALLNIDVSNVITYSGSNTKKIQAQGPDGNTYDFFFGDVDIEVIGDFGTISAYNANGKYSGAQNLFVFDDFCETVGYITECMTLDTSMNIDSDGNFSFNNGIYNEYKKFGLYEGSYRIKNIPSTQAIALLNNEISDNVIISGDSIDLCGNFTAPDGHSYNFYTNEINITVKNPFDGFLPIYSYTDQSYNNGEELLVYSDICTFINKHKMFTHCLNNNATNDVSFSINDPSYVVLDFNRESRYNSRMNYGVYLGNYILNVPESNPIAFFNNGLTNKITYFGDDSKKIRKSDPGGGSIYDYFHGNVVLNVIGDFGEINYHFLNGGYLGGIDSVLKFTDFCNDGETSSAIECLTTKSPIYLKSDASGNLCYILNARSELNNNRKFGLHDGIYEITDICNNYPIALVNNGLTEYIDYTGDSEDLCGNFTGPDGNTYAFYKNKIKIVVSGNFSQSENLSIFSSDGTTSGYYGLQEKLVYSDLCEDTTTQEREQISDDVGSLDFYLLQVSTY